MDQNVILVETVPLEFDLESLGCRLRIRPGQTKFMNRLSRLAEEAARVARPKAVARLCGLTILDEEKVQVGEVTFSSPLLRQKLQDMQVLYRAFQAYTEEKVIVKEEILSFLCRVLPQSQLIRDSVVTLDGYTGFTPVQYRLAESFLVYAKQVFVTVTADEAAGVYGRMGMQNLFYMSRPPASHASAISFTSPRIGSQARLCRSGGCSIGIPSSFRPRILARSKRNPSTW